MSGAPDIMASYPVFNRIPITDPVPAELVDIRTLDYDWNDPSTPGLQAYWMLFQAWVIHAGDPETWTELPALEDPEAVAFAIDVPAFGGIVGAGILYNVSQNLVGDVIEVTCDITAYSAVPGVAEIIVAQADGVEAQAQDPEHPIQTMRVLIR